MTDTPALSLDELRFAAKRLRRDHEAGSAAAVARLQAHPPRVDGAALRHADYLHVIAQEKNFTSWPALKLAAETFGLDRAARQQRLKIALAHGQNRVVAHLLQETPDLADGVLGLQIALYDVAAVRRALSEDPAKAVQPLGPRVPLAHLCFSGWVRARPDLQPDMMQVARLLLSYGADANSSVALGPETDHRLSVLYGAIGHAQDLELAELLLQSGADPNDGESLYHATELPDARGVRLLLRHGAKIAGTNALLRALDFNNHEMVQALLDAGAAPGDFNSAEVGGESPHVMPALHQAARRMCDAAMVELLLAAGADPQAVFQGATVSGYARIFANADLIDVLARQAPTAVMTEIETQLVAALEGGDVRIAQADLPEAYRHLIRHILHLPDKLTAVKRLISAGLDPDLPDPEGLTPVQVAGWEGLPEMMGYLLSLKPDLQHVNGYGGTLLSTIIHGSENCPQRSERNYVGCLELALQAGVLLPSRAIELAGDENVAAFLRDWADSHPDQVIEGGLG